MSRSDAIPSSDAPRDHRSRLCELPIDAQLPAIIAGLRGHNCLALRAPTGAGKTTRVPPALFEAGLAGDKQIVLLQPRRIAARAAAARIAEERGVRLGEEVGYEVRFERRVSGRTRIVAMTDGVLVRMLQDDPLLERVGVLLLDEFHERSLNADLALAMARQVQREVRPDLKIVVMSATLAVEPIAKYLDDCPVVESEGRLFPIDIRYAPPAASVTNEKISIQAARAVRELLPQTPGDVLVFLPGVGEIVATAENLAGYAREHNFALLELYGDLPLERQQAVLAPCPRRKVILSTNVAETSLTIDGVTGVVDAGLARVLRFDADTGINRLEIERISQASAAQRAGRAGRTAPGVCVRLWSREQHRHLPPLDEPEIRRVDFAGPLLELLAWGERDPLALPWFEPPTSAIVEKAFAQLRFLGAVDDRGITDVGRAMAKLPVQPRIARLMVEGATLGVGEIAATIGAILSERDVFPRNNQASLRASANRFDKSSSSNSDVLDRVDFIRNYDRQQRRNFEKGSISVHALRFMQNTTEQLSRLLKHSGIEQVARTDAIPAEDAVLQAIAVAYFDRLARRRAPQSRQAIMVGGRGVKLAASSAVLSSELFVCLQIEETGGQEALVRMASAVERNWLPNELLSATTEVEFDAQRGRVVAYRRTRLQDLLIDEAPTNIPANIDAGAILAREVAKLGDFDRLLDDDTRQLIARMQWLAEMRPELELPRWDVAQITELLPVVCQGLTSLAELRAAPIAAILLQQLSFEQRAALDREAPERLAVPSGSRIALTYEPGKPPVLAVRIQELFGLAETPRIAGGRVPVLLHLLAPNFRPQQVTTDLASFWKNTYGEVKKELKRRYPKHSWPDDPLTAPPQCKGGGTKR